MKKLIVFATMLFAAPAFAQDGKMCVQLEGRPCSGQYIQLPQVKEIGANAARLETLEKDVKRYLARQARIEKRLGSASSAAEVADLKAQLKIVKDQLELTSQALNRDLVNLRKAHNVLAEQEIPRIDHRINKVEAEVKQVKQQAETKDRDTDGRIVALEASRKDGWNLGAHATLIALDSKLGSNAGLGGGLRLTFTREGGGFMFSANGGMLNQVDKDESRGVYWYGLAHVRLHQELYLLVGAANTTANQNSSGAEHSYYVGMAGLAYAWDRFSIESVGIVGIDYRVLKKGPGLNEAAGGVMVNLNINLFR